MTVLDESGGPFVVASFVFTIYFNAFYFLMTVLLWDLQPLKCLGNARMF